MPKRLYRSRRTRMIAGIAGGLAEYFGVDVILIRLLWVIAAFLVGGGILAYIIAWIVIPEEAAAETVIFPDEGASETDGEDRYGAMRRRNAGLFIIVLGIIFLVHQFSIPVFNYFWPILIIAAGIVLLMRNDKGAGE